LLLEGFDTASSIALLALSIVASKGTGESAVSQGKIVVLPVSHGAFLPIDSVLVTGQGLLISFASSFWSVSVSQTMEMGWTCID
jgi:high-affinity nickel permease